MPKNHQSSKRSASKLTDLWFYHKIVALCAVAEAFTTRFLSGADNPILQTSRAAKQRLEEASASGNKLTDQRQRLDAATQDLKMVKDAYFGYIKSQRLDLWKKEHERYNPMLEFCKGHNEASDYEPFLTTWGNEEMANVGYTLCVLAIRMIAAYVKRADDHKAASSGTATVVASHSGAMPDDMSAIQAELAEVRAEIAEVKALLLRLANNANNH